MRPATLSDCPHGILASCNACHRHVVIETVTLIERLGADYPVPQVHWHLRCANCGSKEVQARPEWPSMMGPAAHH